MDARHRSPSYPSTPIEQAIEYARKLHLVERTNPIDRSVAAKAMGYSGLSGRSATVLSDLSQYGLVEKAGKSEVRVTPLAVDLLYPDDQRSLEEALQKAAKNPELFQKVMERFTDGHPSANALESFLVKQGFTHAAIPAAVRAFQQTFSYLENTIVSDGSSHQLPAVQESQSNQRYEEIGTVQHVRQTAPTHGSPERTIGKPASDPTATGAEVNFARKKIWLGGVVTNQVEADELIATINALRPMLPHALALNTADEDDDWGQPPSQ